MKLKSILLFFIITLPLMTAAQQRDSLVQWMEEEKESLESFIQFSQTRIKLSVQESEPFDEDKISNFDQGKEAGDLDTIQAFLSDWLIQYPFINAPYNLVVLRGNIRDLVEFLGYKDSFFYSDHPEELPKIIPLKITFWDGTVKKVKDYKSQSKFFETLDENASIDPDDYKGIEKIFVENEARSVLDLWAFSTTKPIKSIKAEIQIPIRPVLSYELQEPDEEVETPYGPIQLYDIAHNEVSYRMPEGLDEDLFKIYALYKDGRRLRYRSSNGYSGFNSEGITLLKKLVSIYDEAIEKVKAGELKTREEAEKFLIEEKEGKGIELSDEYRTSVTEATYTGPVNRLQVEIVSDEANIKTYEIGLDMGYEKGKEYFIAEDLDSGKEGLVDSKGQWVIEPKWEGSITSLNPFFYRGRPKQGDEKLLWPDFKHKRFKEVPYLIYRNQVNDGHYLIAEKTLNENRGLVDGETGEVTVPLEFHNIYHLKDNFWVVENYKPDISYPLDGVYNSEGQPILPIEFSRIEYDTGFFFTEKEIKDREKWHTQKDVYNQDGENLTKGVYQEIEPDFSSGLLLLKKVKRELSENRTIIAEHTDYFFMDSAGKILASFPEKDYLLVHPYSEGLSLIRRKDGYYGYIDAEGKMALPFHYVAATDFHQGNAFVSFNDKEGVKTAFINKEGVIQKEIKEAVKEDVYFNREEGFYYVKMKNGTTYNFDGELLNEKE